MSTDSSCWSDAEKLIRELLVSSRGRLSQETADAVEHYLEHAEYEMALEGLLLDVMKAYPAGLSVDWSTYEDLARRLGLHSESNFDGRFWETFTRYISHREP